MPARLLTRQLIPELTASLADAERVAVDTEFHAERRYVPDLYLVQLYVPHGDAWIVDPVDEGMLEAIAPALRSVPWLLHGGSQDIRLLGQALGGVPESVLDTQVGAGLLSERYPEGYASLVQRYLGRTLPKTSTLSDWSQRPLSEEQVKYAVDDVLRLPELWAAIARRLDESDRAEIAALACREARDRHLSEPDPQDAWRQFAAAPGMSARARSVLQEVCAWREAAAQERNQPPRTLLGDGTIVELAKRPPSQRDGILANRRFPRSAQKHIGAIWNAIERGRNRSERDAPPCPERFSGPWRALQALRAWVLHVGHEQAFSPKLALDDDRLADLALHSPSTRSDLAQRLGPWRDRLVGDALWAWLDGQTRLSVGPSGLILT
jgi:ribonuclease D